MTLTDLVNLVYSYSHRRASTTFTDKILNEFLPLAEARIGRNLQSAENEAVQAYTDADTIPLDVPANYGKVEAVISHQEGGDVALVSVGIHRIVRMGLNGRPRAYNISNGQIDIRGRAGSSFDLLYWSRPQLDAADPDNATNAVLERWPTLYLQAILVELYQWARDREALATSLDALGAEVTEINKDASRAKGEKPAGRRVL